MNITIVGMGAMGSVYAALFTEDGHTVFGVDDWREHCSAINSNGLRVEGASGSRTLRNITVSENINDFPRSDLYIIATKASGVGKAAELISTVADKDSTIITIQNGLGSGERIEKFVSTKNLLLGVAEGFGASVISPGHIHHNSMKLIRIGELNGGISTRLLKIEELWRKAGFKVKAFEDITQLIWEKFICNVTFSAPCTVFKKTIGELMDNPLLWEIALGGTLEAYSIAIEKNINLSFDDPVKYVTNFGLNMPDAKPSMLLDHISNRKSEIDAINGMIPIMGRELGINTPYSDTLVACVKSAEEEFRG